MLKQQLQQKLQQKLSPAQIQVIKLLEVTTLELEERIRQELEENPALEEGFEESADEVMPNADEPNDADESVDDVNEDGHNDDYEIDTDYEPDTDFEDFDFDYDNDSFDDDIPDYKLKTNNTSKDDKQEDIPFSEGTTFHEYLVEQVGFLQLDEHERNVVMYIIGNIDEEGYLRRMPDVMVDDMLFQSGIETATEDVERLIKLIQAFEPAGVCALNLQECLLLQLERKKQTKEVQYAKRIISDYFEAFSKKHYDKIQRGLNIDDDLLKNVINEIVRLNPKPGNAWGGSVMERTMSTIIPDFILENNEGQLSVHLNNSNVPELHVNTTYNEMLKDYSGNKQNRTREMKDALMFVKQKVESAQWFIDAIRQRQQTLLLTMTAIVEFQKEFFLEGHESFLKPMILKDISDITGYDVSTISRVSNSKYIQTEFGIFPVKYFFSESITNDSGEAVSTREIKKILQECIDNENKRKPMNDDMLAEVLRTKGYPIARRTVAKYREQLGIPVARLRVEL